MPLMDPDVKGNGTNLARVIRYQALKDQDVWYNVSFKKDPFDDDSDIMNDANIETFMKTMDDICEGKVYLLIN
jgi:hypothetical protein